MTISIRFGAHLTVPGAVREASIGLREVSIGLREASIGLREVSIGLLPFGPFILFLALFGSRTRESSSTQRNPIVPPVFVKSIVSSHL
jgi:hypothetical protein